MARKERRSLDNFDTDSNLDFDIVEFDDIYSPKRESRSAVTKIGMSALKGAVSALTGFGMVKKVVLRALPREYGEIDKAFSSGIRSAKDLYHETLKDLSPTLRDFNRSAKRAIPELSKQLPGGLGKSLGKLGDKLPTLEDFKGSSPEELKEQGIQMQLGAVFQQNAAQTAIAQQQLAQGVVSDKLSGLRHAESLGYLNAIRVSTQNIDNYNATVTVNYQRKSLELQIRQLGLTADLVNDGRRFAAETMRRLDGIVQNTGLPDYVKLKSSERYKEAIRNRFIGKSLDSAADRTQAFMGRFGKNIREALKNKVDSIKMAFDAGSMGLEASADQAEMMQQMREAGIMDESLAELLAGQAGGGLAERMAFKGSGWIRKQLDKHGGKKWDQVNYYIKEAARRSTDIPGSLDDVREGRLLDKFIPQWFRDLIPTMSTDTAFEKQRVGNLQEAGQYTERTDKTINTVIPGLLARQLRELTMLRTGRDDVQLLTYDHFKDEFVSKAAMTKTIFEKTVSKDMKSSVGANKSKFEEYFFGEGTEDISPEAKDKFYNFLMSQAIHGKSADPGRFASEEAYLGSGLSYKDSERFQQIFKSRYGYDENNQAIKQDRFATGRTKFQSMYQELGGSVHHQQEVIQTLINAGYFDELRRIGLIDEEGNLDKARYYDYLTGSEFDAKNITNRPGYEGIGAGRVSFRKGETVRPYKTVDLNTNYNDEVERARSANQTGSRTQEFGNLDALIAAVRESNIKVIAEAQSETLQRIETILLEREFGSAKPGALERMMEGKTKLKDWFRKKYTRLSEKFPGTRSFITRAAGMTSAALNWVKKRANNVWDLAKDNIPGMMNAGWKMTKNLAERGWDAASNLAKRGYEFSRDEILPRAKDAANWSWDKAKRGANWGWDKTKAGAEMAKEKLGDLFGGLFDGDEGDSIFGRLGGKVRSGLGWMKDKAKGVGSKFGGMFGGMSTGKQTVSLLTEIRDILDSRLPGKRKKFDKDNSGNRDGSWEDQLKSKEAKEAAAAQSAGGKNADKNNGILSKLAGLLPFGKKKGKEDKEEKEDDDDSLLDDAADIASIADAGAEISGSGKKRSGKGGKRGRFGRLGSFAKGVGKFALKGAGLAGAAYGAYSMVDNLGKGNYGEAALDAGITAGGLALSGVSVGAMLGGLGTAAAVAGSLLMSPVVLTGAALAAGGYGLYKGYKWLTRFKLGDLSRIRYMQYGFSAEDTAHVEQIFGFEAKIAELTQTNGGVPKIDDGKLKIGEVAEALGFDPKNPSQVRAFLTWYQTRFKPVFSTWMAAMSGNKFSKSLTESDALSPPEKLQLINLVAFPNGPYNVQQSPFPDLKALPSTAEAIDAAVRVLRAELEVKGKTIGVNGVKEAAVGAAAATAATKLTDTGKTDSQPTGANTTKNNHLSLAAAAPAAAGMVSGGMAVTIRPDDSNVVHLQLRELSPIESIRMRVYGIKEMDTIKIAAIMRLEAAVRATSSASGAEVVWKGDLYQLASKFSGVFRFSGLNSDQGESWARWFRNRFLPTYLTYLTGLLSVTGSFDKDADYKTLKPEQAINLANRISGATSNGQSVWQVTDSPFPNYSVGTNASILTPFIDIIAKTAAVGATLKEDALNRMNTQTAAGVKASAEGKVPVTGKTEASSSTWDRVKSFGSSIGAAIGGVYEGAKNVVAGLSNAITAPFRGPGTTPSGPAFGGSGPTASTFEGNGGKADSLPDPKGTEGYAAFKDMLEAAAKAVGVDGRLLSIICAIESAFRPAIKAPTSSATGLFQFIKSTWNSMIAKFGKLFGIPTFTPPSDPKAACLMGAQFLKDNIQFLQKALGRKVTFVEAYMAHFLGAGGAAKVLKYPANTVLAPLMPAAAASNPNVFFRNGRALTLAEIYTDFAKKMIAQAKRFGMSLTEEELTQPTTTAPAEKTAEKQEEKAEKEMNGSATPPPSSTAPSVIPGEVPKDNIQKVAYSPSADQAVPPAQSAPSPMAPSAPNPADAEAKQNIANKQYLAESSAVESILKESLRVQITQAQLLASIDKKLDRGMTFANQEVPDTRKAEVTQTSRPMPQAPVPLRRSA